MKVNKIKKIFKKIFIFPSLFMLLLIPISLNIGDSNDSTNVNYSIRFNRAFKVDNQNKPKSYKELGLVKNISIQGLYKGGEEDVKLLEININNEKHEQVPYKLVRINISKGSDIYNLKQIVSNTESITGTSGDFSSHSLNDKNINTGYVIKGDGLPETNNVSIEISLNHPSIINNIEVKMASKNNAKIGPNKIIFRKISLLSQKNNGVNIVNFYNLTSTGVEIITNNNMNIFSLKNIFNSNFSDAYSTEYPAAGKPFVWVPNNSLLLSGKIIEFYTDNDNIRYVVPQLHGGKLEVWIHDSDHSTYDDLDSAGKVRIKNTYNDPLTLISFIKEITDTNLQNSILLFINNISSKLLLKWEDLSTEFLLSISKNPDILLKKESLELSWFSSNNVKNLGINELSNLEYFSLFKGINSLSVYSLYEDDEVPPTINIFKQSWLKNIDSLESIKSKNDSMTEKTILIGDFNEFFTWLIGAPNIKYINLEDYEPYNNNWHSHVYKPEVPDSHKYNPKFVYTIINNENFIKLQDVKARAKKIVKIDFGNYKNKFISEKNFKDNLEYKNTLNFDIAYYGENLYVKTSKTYKKGVIEDPVVRFDYKSTIKINGKLIQSILIEGKWVWNFLENNIDENEITIYYSPIDMYMSQKYFDSLNISAEMSTADFKDDIKPSIHNISRSEILKINDFEPMFSENNLNYKSQFYLNARENDKDGKQIDVKLSGGRYIINLENNQFDSIKYMFKKIILNGDDEIITYYLYDSDSALFNAYNKDDISRLKIDQISTKRTWNNSNNKVSKLFIKTYISNPKNMDESVITINNQKYSNKAIFNSRVIWDEKYFYNNELKENFSIADIVFFDGEQYLTIKYLESIHKIDKNTSKFNYEKLENVIVDPEIKNSINSYKKIKNPQTIIDDLDKKDANNIKTYIDSSLLSIKIKNKKISPYLYNGNFIWPIDIKDIIAEVSDYNTGNIFYITKEDVNDYLNDSNYLVNSVEIPIQSFTSIPLKLPVPNDLISLKLKINKKIDDFKVYSVLSNGTWKYYYNIDVNLSDIIFINKNNDYLTAEYISEDYNENLSIYSDLKDYIRKNGISSLEFSPEYVNNKLSPNNTIKELRKLPSNYKSIIKKGYFYDGIKYDYKIINGNIIIPKNIMNNSRFIYIQDDVVHYELNNNFQKRKFQRKLFSIFNIKYNANPEDKAGISIANYIKDGDNLLNINKDGSYVNMLINKSIDSKGKIIYGIDSANIFVKIKYVTNINGRIVFYTNINDVPANGVNNLSSVDIFSNQNKETNEKQEIIDSFDGDIAKNKINNNKFKVGLYSSIILLSTILVFGLMILIKRIKIRKRS